MSNIDPNALADAIERELTIYTNEVTDEMNKAAKKAATKLVRLTRSTAPVGRRGQFKKKIASKQQKAGHRLFSYVWHVKSPDHRLTHLVVKGHKKKDGAGMTRGNAFLESALNQVLPEYERACKEAAKK